MDDKNTRILVISGGPVPFTKTEMVSGDGARSWSIAQTLKANFKDTTLAVRDIDFAGAPDWCEPYSSLDDLFTLARQYDVVIGPYSQWLIPDLFPMLPTYVLKIADGYTPIHMEVLARDVALSNAQADNFRSDGKAWLRALRFADAILVTSHEQGLYYLGMLLAIDKIDPKTYRNTPIIEAPFGLEAGTEPLSLDQSVERDSKILLWYGGFYPWFDYPLLVDICEELDARGSNVKLLIAGAINPRISEKSFSNPAKEVIEKLQIFKRVTFLPWQEYGSRLESFKGIDAVISLNKQGPETPLSWRLRYTDVLVTHTPLLTNGGDPFGDRLIEEGAALRLTGSISEMTDQIEQSLHHDELQKLRAHSKQTRNQFTWEACYSDLTKYLLSEEPPRLHLGTQEDQHSSITAGALEKNLALVQAFKMHAVEFGLGAALRQTSRFVAKKVISGKSIFKKRIELEGHVFFLHQLEFSGAPKVGCEIIEAFRRENPLALITVVTRKNGDSEMVRFLEKLKVNILVADEQQRFEFKLAKSVLVNSVAVPWKWINQALEAKGTDQANAPLVIFNHEQDPENYLSRSQAKRLVKASQLGARMLVPSKMAQRRFALLHGLGLQADVERLKVQAVPARPIESKLDTITVVVVGPTQDGRKGQTEVLAAVIKAQNKLSQVPNSREVHLLLVGLGQDPIGNEILRTADWLMKPGTFTGIGRVPFETCADALSSANVVVSMSSKESFGLYIAEAMSGGAVVLRTDSGGTSETLVSGVNGFSLDGTVEGLADRLVWMANRDECDNRTLLRLMNASKDLVSPYLSHEYADLVRELSQNG